MPTKKEEEEQQQELKLLDETKKNTPIIKDSKMNKQEDPEVQIGTNNPSKFSLMRLRPFRAWVMHIQLPAYYMPFDMIVAFEQSYGKYSLKRGWH